MKKYQVLTASEKDLGIEELKPSMARAPRKTPKKDVLKSGHAIAGVHYEVLDTKKHINTI